MSRPMQQAALAAIVAFGMSVAVDARADVITFVPNAPLSDTPFVISFEGGAATYAFTIAFLDGVPGAAVATGGNATVSSFFGGIADFGAGSVIDQTMQVYGFSPFPDATAIPNSPAVDFIGLAFTLADGLHYGYAQVAGPNLVSYAYEDTPGASITTSTGDIATPVPEPASLVLLMAGMAGVAVSRRRKRVA